MNDTPPIESERIQGKELPLRWWTQVTVVLLVIVELCWVLPWFYLVTQITRVAPLWQTALILGGIMLGNYTLGAWLEILRLWRNIELALIGLMLIFNLWLAENLLLESPVLGGVAGLARLDPGAVLVLFFVVWMWWRGVSLSRQTIRPIVVWRRFELGLLLFMAYLLIAARVKFTMPELGTIVLFLFTGLLAVALGRVSYVGFSKGVIKNPFDRRWLLSVGGVIGLTVVLAALLGSLLSGQYSRFLDLLSEALKFLIAALIFVLGIPGLLLSYILGPVVPWLQSLFVSPAPTQVPEYPSYPYPLGQVELEPAQLPFAVETICFWGLVVLLIIALVFRIRKALASRRNIEPWEPVSLLKRGEARQLLRKAVRDTWNGLIARLRPSPRQLAAARIRRIYTQLMDLSAELNHPRLSSNTPLEFLPELGELFAQNIRDLELLTDAYIRVRYGELPEDQEELETIETAWQNILEAGQRLKRAGVGRLQTVEIADVERKGV